MSASPPRLPAPGPPTQSPSIEVGSIEVGSIEVASIELGLTVPLARSRPKPPVTPTVPSALVRPPSRPVPAPSLPVLSPGPVVPCTFPATWSPAPPVGPTLLPNVVVPGVSHAGAAALVAHLGRHPQVCLPSVKRIAHFTPLRYGRPVDRPLDEYDRHFARWSGQRYRIENAPDYFDGGLPMARQVAESLPGTRVVLVLRDPVQRLWSSYTDKLARGRLPRAMGFDSYVERCLALRANGADRFEGNRHFRTLSSGFYIEYLPAWLETFGRRARVVFTEDLVDAADDHVGALFDWLGLPQDGVTPPAGDASGPRYPCEAPGATLNQRLWPRRGARQEERARTRVRGLYAGANRELAALLRDHGYSGLPDWLAGA